MILTITLVISLIGLLIYNNYQKTNKVKVSGMGHKVNVDTKNENNGASKENDVEVDGNFNDVNIDTENKK
jgi:hypothetical protein